MDFSALEERVIVEVNLKEEEYEDYVEFVEKVVIPSFRKFVEFKQRTLYNDKPALYFRLRDSSSLLEALIVAGRNPYYRIIGFGKVRENLISSLASSIEGATALYYETKGMGTVYFALVKGMKVTPPKYERGLRRALSKLFMGNMVFVFAISILFFVGLYFIFKEWTPLAIVLSQIPLLLISPKIIAFAMGDWKLSSENRFLYLAGIRIPLDFYDQVLRDFFYPKRFEFKRELYERTLGSGREVTVEDVEELLAKYGFPSVPYEITIKKVDVYSLVKKVFSEYGLPVPEIVLSNVPIANAAASGPDPRFSSIMITTGLLAKLEEGEIEAVIGHEASHIKRRDPLLLYGLSSAEYLSRVAVVLSLYGFFLNYPLLELIYIWFSITMLFIAAKIIEARADLEAALRTGKPRELASALRKIGLLRLLKEKTPNSRLASWISFLDPHPPLSYRVETLSKLDPSGVKGVWREAVKRCFKDLLNSLKESLS
ncbi:MAG: hypothetical protein B6U69_01265 [Thermofilum sp. ex4484_15]|nr:MAG: hypothetical protein B6U69_01265 [Thermofilum sp. ex4484_15]